MKLIRYLVVLILFLPLSGCDWFRDPLVKAINDLWPPVDKVMQQRRSILSSSSALEKIGDPDLYASISTRLIDSAFQSAISDNKLGISNASIRTESQVLTVAFAFNRLFEGDITAEISGKATGIVSFTISDGQSTNTVDVNELELRLLPALTSIEIEEVKVEKEYDVKVAVNMINLMLKDYLRNINGVISSRPELTIKLPVLVPGPIDPKITSSRNVSVLFNRKKITMPTLALKEASILTTKKGIEIIAQLQFGPNEIREATKSKAIEKEFSSFRKEFNLKKSQVFSDLSPSDVIVSINKRTLSKVLQIILNPEEQGSRLCFSMATKEQVYSFNEKIGILDETSIDCTPKRDCSSGHIDCTATRNCTPTKDCGGYKWYQAPDKLRCEAEKSAAKLDCERIKSSDKATCEMNKSAWKLDCERIKSQKNVTCELEKELVKRLSRTGDFANIDGTSTVNASLGACLHSIQLSRNLDNLSLVLDISGTADVATYMKFTPLDIIGHLACQVPWSDKFSLTTTIPNQNIPLSATFTQIRSGDELYLGIKTNGFTLKANMHPSPKQELLNSKNFNISCLPLSGLIRAIDIFSGDVIPEEVDGKIVHEQGTLSFKWPIKPISYSHNDLKILGNLSLDSQAISLYGKLER